DQSHAPRVRSRDQAAPSLVRGGGGSARNGAQASAHTRSRQGYHFWGPVDLGADRRGQPPASMAGVHAALGGRGGGQAISSYPEQAPQEQAPHQEQEQDPALTRWPAPPRLSDASMRRAGGSARSLARVHPGSASRTAWRSLTRRGSRTPRNSSPTGSVASSRGAPSLPRKPSISSRNGSRIEDRGRGSTRSLLACGTRWTHAAPRVRAGHRGRRPT